MGKNRLKKASSKNYIDYYKNNVLENCFDNSYKERIISSRLHGNYHPPYLIFAGLLLLCSIVYSNVYQCGFVFDDMSAVRDNRDIRSEVPLLDLFLNDFWGTPITSVCITLLFLIGITYLNKNFLILKEKSHKSYRPLTVLTFRINYAITGINPSYFHAFNLILHCLVTCLFYAYE